MIEKDLWKKVQRGLGAVLDGMGERLDRVENGVVEGMPDVNMACGSVELWVELKYIDRWPSRANTHVLGKRGLRVEQINWHLRQQRAGGKSFVLVGIGKEIYVAKGSWAKDINGWTSEEWFKKGTKIMNWEDLYMKLFTEYL